MLLDQTSQLLPHLGVGKGWLVFAFHQIVSQKKRISPPAGANLIKDRQTIGVSRSKVVLSKK